jgi:hypothetical protein
MRYSADRSNLAYGGLPSLLTAMEALHRDAGRVLKPNGVVVLTARPWRRDGALIDLPGLLIAAAERPAWSSPSATSPSSPPSATARSYPGRRSSNSTTPARPAKPAPPTRDRPRRRPRLPRPPMTTSIVVAVIVAAPPTLAALLAFIGGRS